MLDSSKLKEFADDNFKFDENGRKLSKRVENTVGKREIARYKQFPLFPQCFRKACFPGASKGVIVWEWVKNCILHNFIIHTVNVSTNFQYNRNKEVGIQETKSLLLCSKTDRPTRGYKDRQADSSIPLQTERFAGI